jgi:gamma-glutamylcyclotransferase (GGCT)/AIG2-like uncharacterized protein YtfP
MAETNIPSMGSLSGDQINDALIRINVLLTREPPDPMALDLLWGTAEALFGSSRHLIVYGSLAPGGPNHGMLSGLSGEWRKGWVTGRLLEKGWSAAMSYPSLRWCPGGGEVRAHLFTSEDLPGYWKRLDEFEGLEYCRILAPFFTDEGEVVVGNVYAMECELGDEEEEG